MARAPSALPVQLANWCWRASHTATRPSAQPDNSHRSGTPPAIRRTGLAAHLRWHAAVCGDGRWSSTSTRGCPAPRGAGSNHSSREGTRLGARPGHAAPASNRAAQRQAAADAAHPRQLAGRGWQRPAAGEWPFFFFFYTEVFNDNAAGVACTAAEEKPLSEESDENSPDSNPCPHTRFRAFKSRFLPILTGSGQFNVLPRTQGEWPHSGLSGGLSGGSSGSGRAVGRPIMRPYGRN